MKIDWSGAQARQFRLGADGTLRQRRHPDRRPPSTPPARDTVATFATRPGIALIAGGLPVVVDGVVIAGIGVAGAITGTEDRRIAERAAAAAIAGSSTPGPGHQLSR
ncbi:MAG TPA: heme-binding protein [Streptosporangiaceae bacterium]|nr:heme-binding protein [Streptosporangiaceae bacterium]